MDTTSRGYPAGDLRVSDADRDAALAEPSEHFRTGRLTAAELDERAGRAISARTGKDLADLMADLPAGTPGPASQPGTDAGLKRPAGRWTPVTTAAALAGIVTVIAVAASHGHGHGVGALWWLIPVALVMFRRLARNSPIRKHPANGSGTGPRSSSGHVIGRGSTR